MKYRNILKAIITAMCCSIVMINFIGCRNYKKENREALEYLNNKYGEEFELKGNLMREGNTKFHLSPIKATKAWPKEKTDNIFTIKLDSDVEFTDDYEDILRQSQAHEYFIDMVGSYLNNSEVYVKLSAGFRNEKFKGDNISDFLMFSGVFSNVYIFLQYDAGFDIDEESQQIYKLYKEFVDRNLQGQINIMYVSKDILKNEKINDELWKNLNGDKSYIKECSIDYSKRYPEMSNKITIEAIKRKLEGSNMEDN